MKRRPIESIFILLVLLSLHCLNLAFSNLSPDCEEAPVMDSEAFFVLHSCVSRIRSHARQRRHSSQQTRRRRRRRFSSVHRLIHTSLHQQQASFINIINHIILKSKREAEDLNQVPRVHRCCSVTLTHSLPIFRFLLARTHTDNLPPLSSTRTLAPSLNLSSHITAFRISQEQLHQGGKPRAAR